MPTTTNSAAAPKKTTTVRRCFALKSGNSAPAQLVDFLFRINSSAQALMYVFAELLGWIQAHETCDDIRDRVRALSPAEFGFVTSLSAEKLEEYRGYVFFMVLCGARAFDPFTGIAGSKRVFDSAEKALKGELEKRRFELLQLENAEIELREGDATGPLNPRLEQVRQELSLLEGGDNLMKRLMDTEQFRPFSPLLQAMSSYPRPLQKLIVEAACQKLLGHYELLLLFRKQSWELELEEHGRSKEDDYRAYLEFRRVDESFFEGLASAPRNPGVYTGFLRNSRIRSFRSDETSDAELADLSFAQLKNASPAIAWFHENHQQWCRYRKGAGKAPTLTLIDPDKHPFHFTLPGPSTASGWYSLSLSAKSNRGQCSLRIFNSDGGEVAVSLAFAARPKLWSLREIPQSKGKRFQFVTQNGETVTRNATLGGLRIRPSGAELFLDLVVNIECDPPSDLASEVAFDKETKSWNFPMDCVVGVVVPEINGTLWGVMKRRTADGWRHLFAGPLKIAEKRWKPLPPVTVVTDNGRRTVSKKEFGNLLRALQRKTSLQQVVPTADAETKRLLGLHLEQRNKRARKEIPDGPSLKATSVGNLLGLDERISALISKLRRLKSQLACVENDREKRRLTKRRSEIIAELKEVRRHLLNCRDNHVKKTVNSVQEFARGSGKLPKIDVLILPARPPKDSGYKRSKGGRSRTANRLLAHSRVGEFCDRVQDAVSLYGISVLRAVTAKTLNFCPRCGCEGVLYEAEGEEGKPVLRRKSKRSGTDAKSFNRFGCLSEGCGVQYDSRHIQAQNMLLRLSKGSAFGIQPEGVPRLKPKDAIAALLKKMSKRKAK